MGCLVQGPSFPPSPPLQVKKTIVTCHRFCRLPFSLVSWLPEPESDLHFRDQQQRAELDVKILPGEGAEGLPSPLWDVRWRVSPLSEQHARSNEPRSGGSETTSRCGRFAGILESLLGIFDKKSHLQQRYCSRLYCNTERKVEFGRRYQPFPQQDSPDRAESIKKAI